jgi:hypothetical protein
MLIFENMRICSPILSALLLSVSLNLSSCKKEESNYLETGTPAFAVYQKDGEPEAFYAYCASHDIYLDSVYVTSPINIKSKLYYQGILYSREIHFLVGDNFIPHDGTWTFVFYGRRVVNGSKFQSYFENKF